MQLPEHVHCVKSRGKSYYYFQIGRNTAAAGDRVALPRDPQSEEFWARYHELRGTAKLDAAKVAFPEHSVGALVLAYAGSAEAEGSGSPEWKKLAENTRTNYRIYLDRMIDAWGKVQAKTITPDIILAVRDSMSDIPFAANSFLAVGSTLWRWGVPRKFSNINPFREIPRLDTEGSGHIPWPQWAWDFAMMHAPEDLARFVFVALHTAQREVDVLRLGPADREGSGITVKPQKTGKRRGWFWVPLTAAALIEFERMEREPVTFTNKRFKKPVIRQTESTYVFSPRGRAYTPDAFRSRWNRWMDGTDAGKELMRRWKEYCLHLAERAGEDLDEEEVKRPALHGLRGSAVVIRRMAGANHQQISNDIGMSIQMVMHYTRFMDQRAAAESNIVLLEEADRRKKGNS